MLPPLLFFCIVAPLVAQERSTNVLVRETLDPATGSVIGQRVALRVDVLLPGGMQHAPRVTMPDVTGAQIMRFETQATTLGETIGGNSYVGQRFEFAIYARRGGTIEIPPATVTLIDRQGEVIGTAEGQPVSLTVTVPPGVDASEPIVAARALTLEQQWAPTPKSTFRAGDAIVRTITRTAQDVPGLAMRDLAFPVPDGVRAYADPPDIDDRESRGVVTGRRVDRVTYLFERDGRFLLSPAAQPWWDLGTGGPKVARATGVTIDVAALPPSIQAGAASAFQWPLLAGAGAVLLVILGFVLRHLQRGDKVMAHAERAAFAEMRRACASADARQTYNAFVRWRPYVEPSKRSRATEATASLDAAVFGGGAPWTIADSKTLIGRLAVLRRTPVALSRPVSLPPLNP